MNSALKHRLPIQHPDYQYPISRNPYWTKLQDIQGRVFSDNETEAHKNHWRSKFQNPTLAKNSELHVEIGCNAGHVIVEWASLYPENAYIGIDWKFKPIFRGTEKALKRNLKNLIFFRSHAERIQYMFGPREVDALYLFFPDPWARKAQWKNRFIHPEQLKQIAPIMKPNGIFHIKTDHRDYFNWMLEAVEKSSDFWKPIEVSMDLHKNHPAPHTLKLPDVTLFESIFIKDKLPIHSLKLQVKACNEN